MNLKRVRRADGPAQAGGHAPLEERHDRVAGVRGGAQQSVRRRCAASPSCVRPRGQAGRSPAVSGAAGPAGRGLGEARGLHARHAAVGQRKAGARGHGGQRALPHHRWRGQVPRAGDDGRALGPEQRKRATATWRAQEAGPAPAFCPTRVAAAASQHAARQEPSAGPDHGKPWARTAGGRHRAGCGHRGTAAVAAFVRCRRHGLRILHQHGRV
eukprot:COSAG06_NODE_1314_length_9887_cov_10.607070_11_plen_213_part_00